MSSAQEIFERFTNENKKTQLALDRALEIICPDKKSCVLLDCGTADGKYAADFIAAKDRSFHLYGMDNKSEMLLEAERNYVHAGAITAKTAVLDFLINDSETIKSALEWDSSARAKEGADIVLCSHIGYYIPPDSREITIARLSKLTSERGALVFIHSEGESQFDELRQLMGRAINTQHDSMQKTHGRIRNTLCNFNMPTVEVKFPCAVTLPNDAVALKAAWFGEPAASLSDLQRKNMKIFEGIISFAGNNRPIPQLRAELGAEKLHHIWNAFWQPRLEECKGQEQLALGVGGGKMLFAFKKEQKELATSVYNKLEELCRRHDAPLPQLYNCSKASTVEKAPRSL